MTTTSRTSELRGEGDIRFSVAVDILQRPYGWDMGMCADVIVDEQDRLWVGSRKSHPISVWTTDGAFLGSWGEADFQEVHGLAVIDGAIWVVDDQLHVARRYSPEGEKTLELGRSGWATAAITHRGQNGGPFNMPTGHRGRAQRRAVRLRRLRQSPGASLLGRREAREVVGPRRDGARRVRSRSTT